MRLGYTDDLLVRIGAKTMVEVIGIFDGDWHFL